LFAYEVVEFPNPVEETPNAQPISTPEEAFIISMDTERGEELARKVKKALGLREAHVILGSNGSNSSLPLYTRYLLEHGRSDQLQIGNRAMIGCLQSHIRVWHKIKDWAYVFEEDTRLHDNSLTIVSTLLLDVRDKPWSVLFLMPACYTLLSRGFGEWRSVGKFAATCDNCTWFGTRGYIITRAGADVMLEYQDPVAVQVDALFGLVNAYDSRFHLYWTRQVVAKWQKSWSKVQNMCEIPLFGRVYSLC
jgi:GR25 family glycosyltransferase involved in LPS biosynthesis